jgi:hypothetical protein
MNENKKYMLTKAALNVVSGLSMVTIISLGIAYMSFNNAFVFTDTEISVTNNPVTAERDIEFFMVGSKKFQCNSTAVYGVAHTTDGSHTHNLDTFTKRYVQNTAPGASVENGWHMKVPEDMKDGGEYRVSMTGEFDCIYMIFKTHKIQTFDNIYLDVVPRHAK